MKITNIETQRRNIALKTPFITALRRVESVEFVRVKIETDKGFIAYGEAPATKAITNEGLDDIVASIEKLQIIMMKKTPQEMLTLLHLHTDIGSSAKAALDMAFVSLLAQEKGVPLYAYLGAKESVVLESDITISLNAVQTMLHDAKKAYQEGMEILKIKLGSDIQHAVAVVLSLAKELPKAKLLIDANQAWSVEESLFFIEAIKECKIELIEQPVIAKDLDGLKQITEATSIPILADEAVFTLEDVIRVHQNGCADMINIKLMKCGGVTQAVEILNYARAHGIKCMLGSMLEGPLSINAALHLAIAYDDVIAFLDLDSPLLYKEASDELEFVYNASQIVLK